MVNKERVKKKLPELLAEGSLTIPSNLYAYQMNRDKLRRFERKRKLDGFVKRIVNVLDELEKAMEEWEL